MQELEKILEEIENTFKENIENIEDENGVHHFVIDSFTATFLAKDIIRKHMNDGWIPVEERLPEDDKYILLSFSNFSLPMIGRYDKDEEGNGSFYLGDCDEQDTCVANDLYVDAWCPLPEPYRPERSRN